MARKKNPTTAKKKDDGVSELRIAKADQAVGELSALEAMLQENIQALAAQLGYEGQMSVAALEDGIRFYQRRTVEACLELGKRLLLLKELAPHGEFVQRVQTLGFSKRSAQRFMQAAAKTSKSANLALLGTQVKSASAFLELVTADDEVLEDLTNLDDIDRMSASELRSRLREAKAEKEAGDELLTAKNQRIDELEQKLNKKRKVKIEKPDEHYQELLALVADHTGVDLSGVATTWRQVFVALQDHDEEHGTDSRVIMQGYVQSLQQICLELREQFHLNVDLDGNGKARWIVGADAEYPDHRPDWMKERDAENATQSDA